MLRTMEESTGTLYWAAEMQRKTRLSKPTVSRAFDKLSEAGLVQKSTETAAQLDHPPRTFYELTPYGLAAIRLLPLST